MYKGAVIKLTANSLSETMEARRHWADIIKVAKESHSQPRMLHLAKFSFKTSSLQWFAIIEDLQSNVMHIVMKSLTLNGF